MISNGIISIETFSIATICDFITNTFTTFTNVRQIILVAAVIFVGVVVIVAIF
jgi:hypothetical protein